jgi:hypothetical protein
MELRIASDRDLVNCYKSLQKLNEDCEKLRAQLKELEEAALPIARLLVPHPGGPKIVPLVDRLKEAPSRLAAYVKHLAKSIPNQVLAFMKSYFPKAPIDVVAGGLAANCTNEQYAELLEQMAPIAEQVVDKLVVPLRVVDSKAVDEQTNFITEEVHLDGQGRSYKVVARTQRPLTAK